MRRVGIPVRTSAPYHQFQNKAERLGQTVKNLAMRIMNKTRVPKNTYHVRGIAGREDLERHHGRIRPRMQPTSVFPGSEIERTHS